MNKAELVKAMAAEAEMTQADCRKVLDAFTALVIKALQEGDKVSLVGFGTFVVTERAAHVGVHPVTKEKIVIPAKKTLKFKPGAELTFE